MVTTPNHNQDITSIYSNIIHLILYPLLYPLSNTIHIVANISSEKAKKAS